MQVQKSKSTEKVKPNFKYLRDKDRELVRGKFIFHEVPGGVMEFVFKKWKEDPVEKFSLRDGEIYSIPLGVAKHLNQNCWYPVHQYYSQEGGSHVMKVGTKVRRCSFQSLEFVDIDDLSPVGTSDIATVEYQPAK
jgi:hypothetical protein